MASIPTVQINVQNAKMGMQTTPGRLEITQPKADLEIQSANSKMDMQSYPGELIIDQSAAWDALGLGSNLQVMNRIYSQSSDIALQGIARIVEEGNRLAQIQNHSDPIPDMAAAAANAEHPMNYVGEASFLNVKLQYIPHKPDIRFSQPSVDINITAHQPEINYSPSKVDIYPVQYLKVEFTPPRIDLKL